MSMFDELRKRMLSSMGVKVCSFDELEQLEIDSIDSVCLSSTASSTSSRMSSHQEDITSLDYDVLQISAKRKVMKILKFIKKLKQLGSARFNLPAFMDLLRDKQYTHVSMSLLDKFMKTFKMTPKPHLLHYYIYFLYYASYYHHTRATTDVIDDKMKKNHQSYQLYLKLQLDYVSYIIKESRNKSSSQHERS